MRIAFLMTEMNGLGGTARATLALAQGLLRRGDEVEIISVFTSPTSGDLDIPRGIRVRTLSPYAMVGAKAAPAGGSGPARLFPSKEELYKRFDAGVEKLIEEALRNLDAEVLISTRTGLAAYLVEFAPAGTLTVAQLHENPRSHNPGLRAQMRKIYARLDAVEVLTQAARRDLTAYAPEAADRVHVLPNAVDDTLACPAEDGTKLVVAVGRLAPMKRYHRLIAAFARLAADYPEWRLRIFGRGDQDLRLRRMADEAGLGDRITVPGPSIPSYAEWAKADIAVSSSKAESFGVSIVEAMRMGVPVVATDVPSGPGEIITSGVDGLLVTPDVEALEAGMRTLMSDRDLRLAMGARAAVTAARYSIDAVAGYHAALLDSLAPQAKAAVGAPPAASRLMVERLDSAAVAVTVTGPERGDLMLRSAATGARVKPDRTETGPDGDVYRIERSQLDTGLRMEDWELSTEPVPYRFDHIGSDLLLGTEARAPSDLLPQVVDGRVVLRSRRRHRYGEVRSVERIESTRLRLEVEVLGDRLRRGELRLLREGSQLFHTVRGEELANGRYRFEFDAGGLAAIHTPLRLSVRMGGSSGPMVTVGSLGSDMAGRRFMGAFAMDADGLPVSWQWGFDKSGSMFLRCDPAEDDDADTDD